MIHHVVCHDCEYEGITEMADFAASAVELHGIVHPDHSMEAQVVAP